MEHSQRSQAIAWFTESQLPFVIRNGIVPEWFHGIISRKEAEDLLMSKPPGYFLIRVGESRIGYSLSYRAADRCRHFMIDATQDGLYNIAGESGLYRCLQDIVDFHRRTPVNPFNEVLTVPCGQLTENETDYAELLFPRRSLNPGNSPRSSLLCQPASQEETPPALSPRTNGSAVGLPERLYPNLEEDVLRHTFPLPAQPVTRTRCAADDPPSSEQPPRVPARTSLPLPSQDPGAARSPLGGNGLPAKASVVSNLKSLKKKLLKKKSSLQEYALSTERAATPGNEYQCVPVPQTHDAQTSHTCTNVELTEGELPYEYRPPPPFAPGF